MKKPHRYQFAHSKPKRDCPQCGQRTLRTYIDTTTNEECDLRCGKCERINNCAYHYTPWDLRRESGDMGEYRPHKPMEPPKPKSTSWRCPKHIVEMTNDHRGNVFAKWLVHHLGERAKEALRTYKCGTYPLTGKVDSLRGAVIWWQVGSDGLHRSGKIMSYLPDGHRDKTNPPLWMHTALTGKRSEDLGVGQVLFGTHLLLQRPDDDVCVVESEKTAVICACFWPDKVWLATGGSDNFTVERCVDLTGRRVWVFPDAGMYNDSPVMDPKTGLQKVKSDGSLAFSKGWLSASKDIELMCESMYVSDILEAMGADEGSDMADYLVPVDTLSSAVEFVREVVETYVVGEGFVEKPKAPTSPVMSLLERPNVAALLKELDFDLSTMTIKPYHP